MPLSNSSVAYARVGLRSDSDEEEGEARSSPENGRVNGDTDHHTPNGRHSSHKTSWTAAPVVSSFSSPSSSLPSSAFVPRWLVLSVGLILLLLVFLYLDAVRSVAAFLGVTSPAALQGLLPGGFGTLAYLGEERGEAAADVSLRLSSAESEMVEILTGRPTVSKLPLPLLTVLRAALQHLVQTMTTLRPSIQRNLWQADCRGHTPCPFPNAALRRVANGSIPDAVSRQRLQGKVPPLSVWMDDWTSAASVDDFFHTHRTAATVAATARRSATADAVTTQAKSPNFPTPPPPPPPQLHFAPGETEEDQELSQRFQTELYAAQHPADCGSAKWLIMDFYHGGGGFGSWNHARSIPMAIAIRAGRTLIEAPQWHQWAYSIAWNDCVRVHGMGGCDIFLAASNCTLPDNWKELALEEKESHEKSKNALAVAGLDALLDWLGERRFLPYSELQKVSGEQWELHHLQADQWQPDTLYSKLPARLDAYRLMPECWWMRQILSYHQRLTPDGQSRLIPMVVRTLQLAEPNVTSHLVQRYAERHSPSTEHTAHWWLLIQAVKLSWQMQQVAPGLAEALRAELLPNSSRMDPGPPSPWAAEAEAFARDPHSRIPLLGYTFVRHGDKAAEVGLMPDHEYIRVATLLAETHGLRQWYVGADSLFSSDVIREINAKAEKPLRLYSSIQTDETPDKGQQPFNGGFDKDASFAHADEDKVPIIWNTILHHAIAQVSDVFLSSWSSNHVRFSYEVHSSLSEARALNTFQGMDTYKYLIAKEGCDHV